MTEYVYVYMYRCTAWLQINNLCHKDVFLSAGNQQQTLQKSKVIFYPLFPKQVNFSLPLTPSFSYTV